MPALAFMLKRKAVKTSCNSVTSWDIFSVLNKSKRWKCFFMVFREKAWQNINAIPIYMCGAKQIIRENMATLNVKPIFWCTLSPFFLLDPLMADFRQAVLLYCVRHEQPWSQWGHSTAIVSTKKKRQETAYFGDVMEIRFIQTKSLQFLL